MKAEDAAAAALSGAVAPEAALALRLGANPSGGAAAPAAPAAAPAGSSLPGRFRRAVQTGPVIGVFAQVVLLGALATTVGLSAAGWLAGVTCGVITSAALAYGLYRYRVEGLRHADWVTLARATLAIGVAALVADSFDRPAPVRMLVSFSALALALDAVDGWVARRTRSTGTLGARFDGEVDAFLILVLSVYVARSAGVWVLAIGVARYAFLAAAWPLTWMRAALPERDWRKVVAATQGIVLTVAAASVLPLALTQAALVAAVALLAESFGRDVWWLWGRRLGPPAQAAPLAGPASGLTILAVALVWAALVAPDQPSAVTAAAFVRVPLEGLVLIALAVVLPVRPRRILAGLVGPVLGLVVILKMLDIAFITFVARPFDPVGDLGNLGTGVETMRSAVGGTRANLIIVGGLVLAVALLVLTTLALLRLTRIAAGHRRWSLRAVGALGALWLLFSLSGAQLLSHTSIASTSTASFVVDEVHTVQADIRDSAVFAKEISHDRFRSTPGNQLLTVLRGKDVLLVFVESYGQVSVQGSSFSPAIDALLDNGTERLRTAGFSARSAFLNAPGFGGISWLAHSSLQSGVWANSQRRYNQLVGSDRFNLNDAFNRAGWRTINFAPADDRDWPEGSSFYHYDKLYDGRDMGYHGPTYSYPPMPDQYMYAALERLELSKTERRPLFAEVDTVSSHMPWDRIPEMVPWNEVGNGSIFNRTPTFTKPTSFWWHPDQVKAAYARALEYSLTALFSFVQHYGNDKTVLIVVGDEQPLPIVSGHIASHDVPISIIAHDPAVLKRIAGWGWQDGLRPNAHAPVWRMDAFRDRFLTAYGSRPASR